MDRKLQFWEWMMTLWYLLTYNCILLCTLLIRLSNCISPVILGWPQSSCAVYFLKHSWQGGMCCYWAHQETLLSHYAWLMCLLESRCETKQKKKWMRVNVTTDGGGRASLINWRVNISCCRDYVEERNHHEQKDTQRYEVTDIEKS